MSEPGGKLSPPMLCDCDYQGGEISLADSMCLRCPFFTRRSVTQVALGSARGGGAQDNE